MTCICVDTLAALGSAVISIDVQSVVVVQFDLASAVSDAVYIRTAGDPGHPLSIYNSASSTSGWWTIHPDYLTLEAAGAPPAGGANDCAPAMQNVLLYLAAVRSATLKLGTRDLVRRRSAAVFLGRGTRSPRLAAVDSGG